jgi:hypothetical protein
MSLFSRVLTAVRSWCRAPGGPKSSRRAGVSVEHLDHRQLLSTYFSGNVKTDFPVTTQPGVVTLANTAPPVTISPDIAPIVKVTGWDVADVRVSYTASDDTLSVGLDQPASGQPGRTGEVVAGDPDNNGNDGTVSEAVALVKGSGFQDFPDFGGSEYMGVFLDLKGTGYADVVAGYSGTDPRSPKQFQVAQAVVDTSSPPTTPGFGTELPQFEGNVYKVNSPAHPNLEFSIAHFSALYAAETGHALAADSVVKIGEFGGSGQDLGIGESFYPEQPFALGAATVPEHECPPASPPVIINPHSNRHVNTAHPDLIRVNVLGSSGFDVSKIEPGTVRLGGATPAFAFDRHINRDEYPDATFVFKGTDVTLPRGFTEAAVSGDLTDGTTFSSSVRVFNRDRSFYGPNQIAAQEAREAARAARHGTAPAVPHGLSRAQNLWFNPAPGVWGPAATAQAATPAATPPAIKVDMILPATTAPKATRPTATTPAPTVTIPTAAPGAPISNKLQASLNRYIRKVGAVQLNTGTVVAGPAEGTTVPAALKAAAQAPFVRSITVTSTRPIPPVGGAS